MIIQNCWRHTGLLNFEENSENTVNAEIVDNIDDDFREDYQRFIVKADIRNAMPVDNFLNPVEKP